MPMYEFLCPTCGAFEQWRPFEAAADPMACPICNTVAKRVYSLPGFRKIPPALVEARARAEKSAYEPQVAVSQRPPSEGPVTARTIRKRGGRPWQLGD